MMDLGRGHLDVALAGRRALQFGLTAICFSAVLRAAPRAEAQQLSAALGTSAPLANAVPDAPLPMLPLAQTLGPSNSAGWQAVPVAAASVHHGARK